MCLHPSHASLWCMLTRLHIVVCSQQSNLISASQIAFLTSSCFASRLEAIAKACRCISSIWSSIALLTTNSCCLKCLPLVSSRSSNAPQQCNSTSALVYCTHSQVLQSDGMYVRVCAGRHKEVTWHKQSSGSACVRPASAAGTGFQVSTLGSHAATDTAPPALLAGISNFVSTPQWVQLCLS